MPALETLEADGSWSMRVVPNKYPAFDGDDAFAVQNLGPVHVQAEASGIHEVFVYSPEHHGGLPQRHPKIAAEVERGSAALIRDLKQRGLLEDTLVVWGGEFGRTVYRQGGNATSYGRDHHPRCFSIWLAGGGIKGGSSYGQTDDWCYNVVDRDTTGVHVHDLNATILHALGLDHRRLTYQFQGLDFKLSGVEPAKVVEDILL